MKFKKILLSIVAIITAFFVTTVKADAPNSFVISASNLTMLYGSNYLGNGSTLNFTYSDNEHSGLLLEKLYIVLKSMIQ